MRVLQLALLAQRAQRFHAPGESFTRDVNEVAVDGVTGGNFKLRKRVRDFFEAQAAALGNIDGARQHVGRVFEHAVHLFVVLDEELRAVELHARRVADRLARLYADHHVLRVRVIFAQVVAVVGRDQRQAEILFQLEQAGMNAVLKFQALILNLKEEIVLAENVGVGSGRRARGFVIVFHQALGDFALQASREADEPAGVLRQKFLADARLVIEAVQRSLGGDLDQVAVSLFVFGEHQQVVVGVAFGSGAVVFLFADVKFAADDGLHAMLVRRVDEMHRAENVAVIGHGDGGHAEFVHALAELFDVTGAIEQGIIGVQVQVDELGHGSVASLTHWGRRKGVDGCGIPGQTGRTLCSAS